MDFLRAHEFLSHPSNYVRPSVAFRVRRCGVAGSQERRPTGRGGGMRQVRVDSLGSSSSGTRTAGDARRRTPPPRLDNDAANEDHAEEQREEGGVCVVCASDAVPMRHDRVTVSRRVPPSLSVSLVSHTRAATAAHRTSGDRDEAEGYAYEEVVENEDAVATTTTRRTKDGQSYTPRHDADTGAAESEAVHSSVPARGRVTVADVTAAAAAAPGTMPPPSKWATTSRICAEGGDALTAVSSTMTPLSGRRAVVAGGRRCRCDEPR